MDTFIYACLSFGIAFALGMYLGKAFRGGTH